MLFIHHISHITYAGCLSRPAAFHSSLALTCHNACSSWQAVLLSCCLNPKMLLSLTPLKKRGAHLQHSVMQDGMLSIQNIWRYHLKKHAEIWKMSTAVNICECLWDLCPDTCSFTLSIYWSVLCLMWKKTLSGFKFLTANCISFNNSTTHKVSPQP